MKIQCPPGLFLDITPVGATPRWLYGINIRFRLEQIETIGLFGPLKDVAGDQIVIDPIGAGSPYRKVYTTPSTTTGQILFGSAEGIKLADYDDNSTPATGTRWEQHDITPVGMPAISDTIVVPSTGRVSIPPVWWFSDQDDIVVGCRANGSIEPCYSWDRVPANRMTPIPTSPLGAVGGGIINRILILLGCTSFSEPDPTRFMTIRWSDRFNFAEWTPSDLTISGEIQLEGGSRIVGGGVTGFGVVVWTDRRMAMLTENGDTNSVFTRTYIDGSRGMLGNNTWCEANGQIYWFDEHRVLNVYDGGKPRQIVNPLKNATLERLETGDAARAYLVPNQEYGEIILHYPDSEAGDQNPDSQLVYNFEMDCWTLWRLPRTGWSPRYGVINAIAIDHTGKVWQHDLNVAIPDAYIDGPGNPNPAATPLQMIAAYANPEEVDVEPFSFGVLTNLITTEDATEATWHMTRILADHLPSPSIGAESDTFDVVLTGYGEAQTISDKVQDWQTYAQGTNAADFRVGGKALQIGLYGYDIKTVFRFGAFVVTPADDGER